MEAINNLTLKAAYRVYWFVEDLIVRLEASPVTESLYPPLEDTSFDLEAYITNAFATQRQREVFDSLEHKYGITKLASREESI